MNTENNYFVYIHTNKINNKKYIGITKQNPPSIRWGVDGSGYKGKTRFASAIKHYGWDNFNHEIVYEGLTFDEANLKEKELIIQYRTMEKDYGYNMTSGGDTFIMSDEAKKKKSMAMLGNKNGLGKSCSPEKAKKISDSQKGKTLTEEHKAKLRKPKSVSYPCSEEKRQHIIDAKKDKKPVICITTNIEYQSIQEAARQTGIDASAICAVCKGKHKHTHGLVFKYKNNNDI